MTLGGLVRCVPAPFHWARIAIFGLLAPRFERRPLEIVQAVIEGPQGVLLAVRWELHGWELPGGGVEPGEDDASALRRELREELGIEVEPGLRVGDYVRSGFRPHVARVYRCRIVAGTPRPSAEVPRVGWFDPASPPAELFVWCRQPLRDAVAGGPPVARREHQGWPEILATMRADLAMRAQGRAGTPRPAPSLPGS